MRERLRPRDAVRCRDRIVMADRVSLVGVYEIHEEDPRTGERRLIAEKRNTIQAAGKHLFLDLMAGLSSDHLTSGTDFVIKDGGGTVIKTLGSTSSGPSYDEVNQDPRVSWSWKDATADVYTIGSVEVHSPAGVVISVTSSPYADNSKPADKNWTYTYRLTFVAGSGAPFDDGSTGAYAGFDDIVRLLTGNSSTHFDGTTTLEALDASTGSLGTVTADGAPTRSGTTLEWTFTAGTSELNGDWDIIEIEKAVGADRLRRSSADGLGTKGSSTIREITYQFTI